MSDEDDDGVPAWVRDPDRSEWGWYDWYQWGTPPPTVRR